MSDNSDDEAVPNWDLLSSELSGSALAALQQHMDSKTVASLSEPISETPSNLEGQTPENMMTNMKFKKKEYWEERFQEEKEYEWLANWSTVSEHLEQILPSKTSVPKILVVGCGNSEFSADLYDAGWTDITSIDFSQVVIQNMETRNAARSGMKWEVMDMLTLEGFPDSSFDVILDKAAMDALMCDEGSPWDPNPVTKVDAGSMCAAISRVLTSTGLFVQISFAQPHFRLRYLTAFQDEHCADRPYGWAVTHRGFGEPGCLESFIYICQK